MVYYGGSHEGVLSTDVRVDWIKGKVGNESVRDGFGLESDASGRINQLMSNNKRRRLTVTTSDNSLSHGTCGALWPACEVEQGLWRSDVRRIWRRELGFHQNKASAKRRFEQIKLDLWERPNEGPTRSL